MNTAVAAWAQLRHHPSRLIATVVAITIGIGFASAALVFTATFKADFSVKMSTEYAAADVVVTPTGALSSAEVADRLTSRPDVDHAVPLYDATVDFAAAESHGYLTLKTASPNPEMRWATLESGHWPTSSDGIVVDQDTATAANLTLGTTMTLTGWGAPGVEPERTVTVVGIAQHIKSLYSGRLTGYLSPQAFVKLGVDSAPLIAVVGAPGTTPDSLSAAINADVSGSFARTVGAQTADDIARFTGQTTALQAVLLGFATIALLVAAIVISNTFTILLAGRKRQIALMRLIGATGAQLRTQIIAEAAVIGAVGSLLGISVGIGGGILGAHLAGFDSAGSAIPALGVVVIAAIGVTITMLAAVVPASRATRVAPIAALTPVSEPARAARMGRARLTVGIALSVIGSASLAGGVFVGDLRPALAGGACSAVGVLLLARSFLPPVMRLVGHLSGRYSVPGRLAALNTVRNPGRTTVTSVALIIGVGLIVMLQVAAASAQTSVDAAVAGRYPVDVALSGSSDIPDSVITSVAAIDGVAQSVVIPGAHTTVTDPQGHPLLGSAYSERNADGSDAGSDALMIGVPADAASVLRTSIAVFDHPVNGHPVAQVPGWWHDSGWINDGDPIVVTVDGRSETFTAVLGGLADHGALSNAMIVTSADALNRLAPNAAPAALWALLDDPNHASDTVSDINQALVGHPDIFVNGAAADRASMQQMLSGVTTLASGLLAVAVAIGVIGIANTIGLSVIERTRESALLRSLGLKRSGLRLMLALEGVLMAVVGALVGIVLGLVYGWAGAAATFKEAGQSLVLDVPWGSIGAIVLAAVVAGALVSVLPARRAVRADPVAALAVE